MGVWSQQTGAAAPEAAHALGDGRALPGLKASVAQSLRSAVLFPLQPPVAESLGRRGAAPSAQAWSKGLRGMSSATPGPRISRCVPPTHSLSPSFCLVLGFTCGKGQRRLCVQYTTKVMLLCFPTAQFSPVEPLYVADVSYLSPFMVPLPPCVV